VGHVKIPGRTFVYSMLFLMTAINYLDRVNLSVAANTIAKELGLTPIQLGWIFSAFLWSYIVILIPAGYLADRFGARRLAPGAVAFWSLATASTAAVTGIVGLMAARICLGTGEAAAWPVGTKTVRAWAPRSEYGLAISAISLGQSFGVGFGALFVGWLVFAGGWRMSFVVTGAIGLVWALVWVMTIRDPKDTKWLSDEERAYILKTRDDSAPAQGSTGFASLLKSPSLWALTLAQGCLVYAYYMLLSWLPNYLQTQRGIAVFGSGLYTAIIYGTAVAGAILLARATDKIFTPEALKAGARKKAVIASFVPAMLMATTPWLESTWAVILALTIAVTFLANAISLNTVLCNDLVRNSGIASKAVALFTSGANVVGVTAPIVTGYIVSSSKAFDAAFAFTGAMLVLGAIILLVFVRGGVGEAESTAPAAPAGKPA
jgi:ACS family glucarate transporter-like MFS transporter